MKKILIIGANGFVGRDLLNHLSALNSYAVVGSSLSEDIVDVGSQQVAHKPYHFIQADIREERAIQFLFQQVKPDVVINTAALSAVDHCEKHPEEARLINVTAVTSLAQACKQYNSRFIHLSTDFIFDGSTEKLYQETDKAQPVNYYGVTKLDSEREVVTHCSNYAIIRVVVVYGNPFPGQHGNIVQLVANKLRAGETIRVASDQWRTPTFVNDISRGIEQLLFHPLSGTYHLCGRDCVTIADIAYRVANYLQLDASFIEPITTEELRERTPRPRFSGLSIVKAQNEFNYQPRSLDEGIKAMFS